MKTTQRTGSRHIGALRFDLIGMTLTAALAILLVVLFDTGSLAQWIARHKHTKIDEIVFTSILLIAAFGIFSMRKWLGLSRMLTRCEESRDALPHPEMDRMKSAQRRDLFGLALVLLTSFLLVMFFDTGSLAEWIALHKDSKIDEVIVTGVILVIGLLFFSIRRWLELTDQVVKYEALHKKTTKLNREIALLGEFSELLQSCLSTEEAHSLITARAQVLFPGSSGAVCVTASSRDIVEVVATWGTPALTERHFEPKDCWALRRGRIHKADTDTTSHTCNHLGKNGSVRSMCVPMMAHGEALGLLYLDSLPTDAPPSAAVAAELSETEDRLARTFAEQAALALANLNMRDVLKMQSVRDPLTGLFNRRYMEESLEREVRRGLRKNSNVSVLMLDVDHFKNFNDTFGHDAGDAVLRSLAALLKTHFRAEDIVCRYGGEELAVILPDATLEVAAQRSSQLCEVVRQMLVKHRGQSLHAITLSIGVASYPEHGDSVDTLLRAADSALYHAKKQGRDRVVLSSSFTERKESSENVLAIG